ncbi:MAG: MGMT family protein [Candidatus Bipolaricaulota bacterium]
MSSLYDAIYALIRQVPPGKVVTYGHVAQLAGCGARTVGWALAALRTEPVGPSVPWHRVINAQGRCSLGDEQQQLLEAEGVAFDREGRTDLARFGWDGP